MKLGTCYRTLRHTRCSQLLWRGLYRVERALRPQGTPRWQWQAARDPRVRGDLPRLPIADMAPAQIAQTVALLGAGRFCHLNCTRELGYEHPDWQLLIPILPRIALHRKSSPRGLGFAASSAARRSLAMQPSLGPVAAGRLWTVTLHYHAWAYDLARAAAAGGPDADTAAELFRHYVSDWIARCRLDAPGARDLAWSAYAVATRLGWWIRSYVVLGPARLAGWGRFRGDFLRSLWQQAAYLHEHVEWDLRANHLLRDAVGLAWAGRFFAESSAKRWLRTAARVARQQVREQVLPDGGHFERSPMYHGQALADFGTLSLLLIPILPMIALHRKSSPRGLGFAASTAARRSWAMQPSIVEDADLREELRAVWQRMAEYAMWLRHPDGEIPLLNDAALNGPGYPESEALQHCWQASSGTPCAEQQPLVDPRPRRGGRHFADSGIVVWHGDPWSVFFDVGPVGPDEQPGHAHADTLTLEASYCGRRLLADPGTYGYDHDERRRYDRSTAAHNTVCVDGADSSEVWHIFRVGRLARPAGVDVSVTSTAMTAQASHTGYAHLAGRPQHVRRLSVCDGGELAIVDCVAGSGRHAVQGNFLLAPGWTAAAAAGGWLLTGHGQSLRVTVERPAEMRLSAGNAAYHPGFGSEECVTRLSWHGEVQLPVQVRTTFQTQP